MIRIAAVGDVHLGPDSGGSLRPELEPLPDQADLLLLAGDLTRHGTLDEAAVVAAELRDLPVPVVAVLGNHDYHSDRQDDIAALLRDRGVTVLEGDTTVLVIDGVRVGIAGVKGFGGGFADRRVHPFGEPQVREFINHTRQLAASLRAGLVSLDTDVTIALTHYAPAEDTVRGEPLELYPFLGSGLLGRAIDAGPADLAVHGHAHFGTEHGVTPGGVPVRNVAQPVIEAPFRVYTLDSPG